MAHIEARQRRTIIKHPIHIGYLAGVQVFHSLDGLKVLHLSEPCVGRCWASICKRSVKDRLGNTGIGVVIVPIWSIFACVQVIGCACS